MSDDLEKKQIYVIELRGARDAPANSMARGACAESS